MLLHRVGPEAFELCTRSYAANLAMADGVLGRIRVRGRRIIAFVTRDGVRLYYEDHGSGPAVLHRTATAPPGRCGKIKLRLKDRYRVIVWDLRGHGESGPILFGSMRSRIWRPCSINAVLSVLSSAGIRLAAIRRTFHRVHSIAVPR